jgi:cold shock CspA family protein/ribosome-associated translation inhibitor RaiA
MSFPVQITARHLETTKETEDWIRKEAAKLETFYGRIIDCRVVLEMPHQHHKRGNLYNVRIYLTVPGAELVIKREPTLSQQARDFGSVALRKKMEVRAPHANLRRVIDDAFKAAGRRLQDYVRRHRGDTKRHETLPQGYVTRILPEQNFGFLQTPDGREIYFHRSSVLNNEFDRIREGARVAFVEERGDKGPQASTVRIVRKSRRRPPQKSAQAAGSVEVSA